MARWQRRARLALAVFAVAMMGVVYAVMEHRRTPASVARVERADPKAVIETKGGDVIQVKGAKRDIQVKFGSQIVYEDGRTKLTDFIATIDDRGGRGFVVTGKEAWIGADLAFYDVRGSVVLKTSDGLVAQSEHAVYTEAEGILKAPGPVQFQRGRMSGSGVGFTYDRARDTLWLLDQAVIRFAPEGDSEGMEVTAGAAGHARADRYLRFERSVRMMREGQLVEANESTVFLQPDRDEPDRIELRGNSKIAGAKATGSLQAMQAQDINLDYAPDGRALEHALLVAQASMQLARADGSPGQALSAEWIDMSLAADGAVTSLTARDAVRVGLPATADAPARSVTCASLSGTGAAGEGLTAMTFEGGIEYREDASRGGASRVARARTLKAAMSSSGTIDDATFIGDFRFDEGGLHATSTDARYHVAKGTIALTSAEGAPRPAVADERMSVEATSIDVTLSPRQMTAAGNVSSALRPGRKREGDGGATLLKATEEVLVTADTLAFDEQAGRGKYSGKARLWQGDTSIQGDTITFDDAKGDLTAVGSVIATLPIAARKEGQRESHPVARAGEFQYEDAKRRAVYTKLAQFDGAQGNLHAERIELFLAAKDNALERLEASSKVRIELDKRQATGERLTYLPADERYVLSGAPVRLIQGCQESTGRTLTFYKASDRISIDGNEVIRTQTTSIGKCPETPRD